MNVGLQTLPGRHKPFVWNSIPRHKFHPMISAGKLCPNLLSPRREVKVGIKLRRTCNNAYTCYCQQRESPPGRAFQSRLHEDRLLIESSIVEEFPMHEIRIQEQPSEFQQPVHVREAGQEAQRRAQH